MADGNQKISYASTGVDYTILDRVKIMAQQMGKSTVANLASGFTEVGQSRGESAHVIDVGDFYFASIEEGLGTKNLVADEMERLTGRTFYDAIAIDTVAMMVNDIITVGAEPLVVQAYWAVGASEWFANESRSEALINGWKQACDMSSAVWGGGETPTLRDLVNSDSIDLAGACVGIVRPKERLLLGDKLKAGDKIVVFHSSGIHANGLTLARELAKGAPQGYLTQLGDGTTFGEALLTPTIIYAKLIKALQEAGADLHYAVNVTGHGWRKLMRHTSPFTYRMKALPPVPSCLAFCSAQAGLNHEEAYATFNMGAGFAVFVPPADVEMVLAKAKEQGIGALLAGMVEEGPKQVIIEPLGVAYSAESMTIR